MTIPREVAKVFAYITHGNSILILNHPDHPEAGIQVPAGSIEYGESPRNGVLREAFEESGLASIRLIRFLGLVRVKFPKEGFHEFHNRWFFHLNCDDDPPDIWRHQEMTPSDGSPPVWFEFSWVDLNHIALDWGHDAMLDRLRHSLEFGTDKTD